MADQALVRLELAGEMVPSLDWFVYAFVRMETVASAQIAGTQATLVDLLNFEAQEGGVEGSPPTADVEEVCTMGLRSDAGREGCLGPTSDDDAQASRSAS